MPRLSNGPQKTRMEKAFAFVLAKLDREEQEKVLRAFVGGRLGMCLLHFQQPMVNLSASLSYYPCVRSLEATKRIHSHLRFPIVVPDDGSEGEVLPSWIGD